MVWWGVVWLEVLLGFRGTKGGAVGWGLCRQQVHLDTSMVRLGLGRVSVRIRVGVGRSGRLSIVHLCGAGWDMKTFEAGMNSL